MSVCVCDSVHVCVHVRFLHVCEVCQYDKDLRLWYMPHTSVLTLPHKRPHCSLTFVEECSNGKSLSRGPVNAPPLLQPSQPLLDMALIQSFVYILYK